MHWSGMEWGNGWDSETVGHSRKGQKVISYYASNSSLASGLLAAQVSSLQLCNSLSILNSVAGFTLLYSASLLLAAYLTRICLHVNRDC